MTILDSLVDVGPVAARIIHPALPEIHV